MLPGWTLPIRNIWGGFRGYGWVRRSWDWREASRVGVHGQGNVRGAKDGYRGFEMGVEAFGWMLRA